MHRSNFETDSTLEPLKSPNLGMFKQTSDDPYSLTAKVLNRKHRNQLALLTIS